VSRSADIKDVEALVRFWLVIPKCEVTCKTDDLAPVNIGFPDARAVLNHYYQQEMEKASWKSAVEVRTESRPGIELAYLVSKSDFADVWDFFKMPDRTRRTPMELESDMFLSLPPGMCVEGVRVRSVPAGYESISDSPWTFANLTGQDSPKTNVARSDVEQTPELDRALLQIYSLIGTHIQSEFDRLRAKKTGILEAAWEADYMRTWGLEQSHLSSKEKFREAMSNLRVIALENQTACYAVTQSELEALEEVWTVDSRLVRNIEGICGTLGLDLPAKEIIRGLGKTVEPAIPMPRILGSSKGPISTRDIAKIRIFPEERSHRIDICWEKETPDRWLEVSELLRYQTPTDYRLRWPEESIWITRDKSVSSECPEFDLVFWRKRCLILATSPIPDLLDALGFGPRFARYLAILINLGEIPLDERPVLKQHLVEAGEKKADELADRMVLPFERRFGYSSRTGSRGAHLFSNDW
jgi:molecular chaperone HtpG